MCDLLRLRTDERNDRCAKKQSKAAAPLSRCIPPFNPEVAKARHANDPAPNCAYDGADQRSVSHIPSAHIALRNGSQYLDCVRCPFRVLFGHTRQPRIPAERRHEPSALCCIHGAPELQLLFGGEPVPQLLFLGSHNLMIAVLLEFLRIDRTSLFQRRGRAPYKSTVKWRFRAISVTMRCCNTNIWRHCGSLATRLLRGVVSSDLPALGGVRVAGESVTKSPRESLLFRIMAMVKAKIKGNRLEAARSATCVVRGGKPKCLQSTRQQYCCWCAEKWLLPYSSDYCLRAALPASSAGCQRASRN